MISPERFENGREMLLAGLAQRFSLQTRVNIPSLWAKFGSSIGKVPGQVGQASYGATWNSDANCDFDYMAAVEVKDALALAERVRELLPDEGKRADMAAAAGAWSRENAGAVERTLAAIRAELAGLRR